MPVWVSIDPRDNSVVPYDATTSALLESSYAAGLPEQRLVFGSNIFVVRFAEMRQYNASGLHRQVMRQDSEAATRKKPRNSDPVDVDGLLLAAAAADMMDNIVAEVRQNIKNRKFRVKALSPTHIQSVVQVYNIILDLLQDGSIVTTYGGYPRDAALCSSIRLSQPVPPYFANVAGESIYYRKVLSVLGLRNLVVHGVEIFNDLLAKLFSGNIADYSSGTGLDRMKVLTGNTVDLDTVVLNPSKQMKEINAMTTNSGARPFSSAAEFEQSPMCTSMVYAAAEPLIVEFQSALGLTDAEMKRRNLMLDKKVPIHTATHNTDRGLHPVWHYQNVGVSTYHANVPHVDDIIGALLLGPFHAAKAFALVWSDDSLTEDERLNSFFEDCISDSCFNGKWKAIEMFLDKVATAHDIQHVLDDLQTKHQDKFTPVLRKDTEDRKLERALMLKLIQDLQLTGIDPKTKAKRRITEADLSDWIARTNNV